MQFRKTAVAVAIAGIAAGSPQIASADTVLTGVVEIQVDGSDDNTLVEDDDGNLTTVEEGDIEINGGDVLAGILFSHDLALGATGYGSFRLDSEGLSGNEVTSDNVYVGIRGGFGDFRFGEIPYAGEYGQLAGDLFDLTDNAVGGVSYTGVFGPVVFGADFSPEANEDSASLGIRFNFAGLSFGLGVGTIEDDGNFTAGISYGIAGFSISGHFQGGENDGPADDTEIIAIKLGYAIQALSFGLTYSEQTDNDGLGGGDDTQDLTRFDVGLGLGGGMGVSARFDTGSDIDDEYRILLSKTF